MRRVLLTTEEEPMTEKTTTTTERIGISPSGGGIAVWVGEEITLHLDWEQARQLYTLLADQLDGAER